MQTTCKAAEHPSTLVVPSRGTYANLWRRRSGPASICLNPVRIPPKLLCQAHLAGGQSRLSDTVTRRGCLTLSALVISSLSCRPSSATPTDVLGTQAFSVTIRPDLAPDQSKYDPADPDLREAANLLQRALNSEDVNAEELLWTEIIDRYSGLDKPWVPDVVGRAWGNRGNARSRQGKLTAALADYNTSINICPWSVDPVLNRGVALEALGRYDDAIRDYRAVLEASPNDPAAWNNLGNASGGLGRWSDAVEYYSKAASLAPNFAFASANRALALFQVGQTEDAIRSMRTLLRKYPEFPDMRAALAAALWSIGKEGEAETNWARVEDPRYKDKQWLAQKRRWPPRMNEAVEALINLKSI